MGTGEESTPAKPSKTAASTQEIPATLSYPDWSNSMQAYYGAGATPPPFFAPTVASPSPHPYLWGSQHPLIPPYGTPVPYPALYPAGVYAQTNMAMTPNSAQAGAELVGKGLNGKDRTSTKKPRATSGGKAGESAKVASGSGNDGASQSADSGSDGSSDGSDDNTNEQEFAANKKGSFDQMLADANAQNISAGANIQGSAPGKAIVPVPATNLNIGMDLWDSPATAASGGAKMRSTAVVPTGMPEQWDERELKRQKRKQSNRESARRSRLRKQAECEELQARVENLSNDNSNLRDELKRLSDECEKLGSENDSIKEELTRLYGADAIGDLEQNNSSSALQSHGEEGNG
ncbi:hypothetical protein K2173_021454 [Erythroxylum novogranatense]|uniref:BZIP domain-containing protein n=1 Tax=Erythroxylum novogranatense TaxID=1862640 RepID=A0AAV8TV95_9ROSI|nr:hypothetical protein K2173_021454 [Erythroxylum novogranatense]